MTRRQWALVGVTVGLVTLAAGALAQHPQGDVGRLRPWLIAAVLVGAVGAGLGWDTRRGMRVLGIGVVVVALFAAADYATAPITADSGQTDCGTLFNGEPISRGPCVGARRRRQVAAGVGIVVAMAGAVAALRLTERSSGAAAG